MSIYNSMMNRLECSHCGSPRLNFYDSEIEDMITENHFIECRNCKRWFNEISDGCIWWENNQGIPPPIEWNLRLVLIERFEP